MEAVIQIQNREVISNVYFFSKFSATHIIYLGNLHHLHYYGDFHFSRISGLETAAMKETTFETATMKETTFETTAMKETTFETAAMKETTFETAAMKETTFKTAAIKETTFKATHFEMPRLSEISGGILVTQNSYLRVINKIQIF